MYRTLRKPEAEGHLVLTERDRLWLRAVNRFRFITTDQAQALSGSTSRDGVNRRLQTLYAFDYLDRPEVQLEAFAYADKRHTVHALGQRGAEWLTVNDGVRFPAGKGWKTANQLKSGERLTHQIGLVDTVLLLERQINGAPGYRMNHQDELLALTKWPTRLKPYRLPTKIEQGGQLMDRGTDPDYTFSVTRTVDNKEQNGLCFLEWDNSSEDFIKSNRLASSIAQKHQCYAYAYREQLQKALYGFKNFRVLFVVNGDQKRIAKMKEVCERVVSGAPKGIFWYTTHSELVEHGPLAEIWLTGAGEKRALA